MAKKKKERSSAPKLGAQYQAAKLVVQIAGPPARILVHPAVQDKDKQAEVITEFKNRNYLKGVAVALIDQVGSKKLGHAQALSRVAVTALGPEVYATAGSALDKDLDPDDTYSEFQQRTTGYTPQNRQFSLKDSGAKSYFLSKYGLGIARKVVNRTRIAEPVKKALSLMGVSL